SLYLLFFILYLFVFLFCLFFFFFFFFFQAEDGIRDATVTGVHTCALPIWALRLDQRVDVLRAEEPVETGISARLVGEQVGPAVFRRRAEGRALRAVHADADEVCERLTRVGRHLGRLRRAGPEHGRDVDRGVCEDRVRRRDG